MAAVWGRTRPMADALANGEVAPSADLTRVGLGAGPR